MRFLEERNFCDDSDLIFLNLPNEITVRNYVSLCQDLHQATLFFMSTDSQLDLVEDELVDSHPSYINPRRGSCWLYNHSNRDSDDNPTADTDGGSDDGFLSEVNIAESDVSDDTDGLWFGAAQTISRVGNPKADTHGDSDNDALLKVNTVGNDAGGDGNDGSHHIPIEKDFVQVDSVTPWGETLDSSSDEYVMIDGLRPNEYLENFAATVIQRWWRSSLPSKRPSLILESESTMNPAGEELTGHSSQMIRGDVSVHEHGQEVSATHGRSKEQMHAITLFFAVFAAHVAFKLIEFMLLKYI